jgi:DNA-binding response OmpR family regulator
MVSSLAAVTHKPDRSSSRQVLLVDRSAENREVLRFALQRRGVEILEADEPAAGIDLLRERRPEVVVLDLEIAEDQASTLGEFGAATESTAGRLVILGSLGASEDISRTPNTFAKPYHFAPLILKIEELLAEV